MLEPTAILLNVLLFAGVFSAIYALFRFPVPTEVPTHRRIALAVGAGRRQTIFEWPVIAPITSFALTLAQRFTFHAIRDRIRRDLDAAGNPNGYSVEEYIAMCLLCMVLMALLACAITFVMLNQFHPLVIIPLALFGFFIPILTASQSAKSRVLRIGKQLPYTVDLIALMMGAGSTFNEAVVAIVKDNPEEDLNQELRLVQAEIAFGSPRAAALTHMAERIPLDTLRSIVGAVNQAETLGTPLAVILKNQADTIRMHRSVRAEKLAASASLRILIPSMLILIAVVLTMFAPMIIKWVVSGSVLGQ